MRDQDPTDQFHSQRVKLEETTEAMGQGALEGLDIIASCAMDLLVSLGGEVQLLLVIQKLKMKMPLYQSIVRHQKMFSRHEQVYRSAVTLQFNFLTHWNR